MEDVIKVENLSFAYNEERETINRISFSVQKGQYVTILGHNGSGKSTIAKLLIGLLEKKSGSIWIAGKELTVENLYAIREHIGIVFQNPDNQFIGATVRDDIAFGLENMCVNPHNMEQLITTYAKRVGMIDFLDHEPTKLSGGQKQRVAIAGILAMAPDIIILDEATSMLDPIGKREINSLVKELNKEKDMTIISITHDIEEAVFADQIILLHEGKIIDVGSPETILRKTELLTNLELDIPFALKVSEGLAQQNIQVKKHLSIEKMVEELCQLHSKK